MRELDPDENIFSGEVGLWGKVLLMALHDAYSHDTEKKRSALLFLAGSGNFPLVCRALGIQKRNCTN